MFFINVLLLLLCIIQLIVIIFIISIIFTMARNSNGTHATNGPTSNFRTYSHDGAKTKIIDYYSTFMTKYNGYYNEANATNTSGEYYKLYFTIPLNSEFSSFVKLTIETTTIPNSTHKFTIRLDDTCIEPFNTIKHKFSNINTSEFTDKNYNKHLNIQYFINKNDSINVIFIQLFKLLKDINTEIITLMDDEDVDADEYAEEAEESRQTTNEVINTTNSAPSISGGLSISNILSILSSSSAPSVAIAPSAPSVAIAPSAPSVQRAPSVASSPIVVASAPSVQRAPSVAIAPSIKTNTEMYNITAKKHLEHINYLKMSQSIIDKQIDILQLQITQLQSSRHNITTDIFNEEEVYNTENANHINSLRTRDSIATDITVSIPDIIATSTSTSASATAIATVATTTATATVATATATVTTATVATSATATVATDITLSATIINEPKSTDVVENIRVIEPITIINDIPTNKIDNTDNTDNTVIVNVVKRVLWSDITDD